MNWRTFDVSVFIKDLCRLGSAFEYCDALMKVRYGHDVQAGRVYTMKEGFVTASRF